MSTNKHRGVNTAVLIGRLTKDAELKQLTNGALCKLRLAVDGMGSGGQAGYVDVAAFGGLANALAPHLAKGRLIALRGKLHWHQWETEDGTSRQAHSLIAEDIQLLDAPSRDDARAAASVASPTAAP